MSKQTKDKKKINRNYFVVSPARGLLKKPSLRFADEITGMNVLGFRNKKFILRYCSERSRFMLALRNAYKEKAPNSILLKRSWSDCRVYSARVFHRQPITSTCQNYHFCPWCWARSIVPKLQAFTNAYRDSQLPFLGARARMQIKTPELISNPWPAVRKARGVFREAIDGLSCFDGGMVAVRPIWLSRGKPDGGDYLLDVSMFAVPNRPRFRTSRSLEETMNLFWDQVREAATYIDGVHPVDYGYRKLFYSTSFNTVLPQLFTQPTSMFSAPIHSAVQMMLSKTRRVRQVSTFGVVRRVNTPQFKHELLARRRQDKHMAMEYAI